MVELLLVIILGVFSYTDIKTRMINKKLLWISLVGISSIACIKYGVLEVLSGIAIGLGLSIVSLVIPGAIGIGDGLIFIICGSVLGFEGTLLLCVFAFGLAGVLGGAYALLRKQTVKLEIPFVPFIFLAYMGVLLYERCL